jgi:hypothetical protein
MSKRTDTELLDWLDRGAVGFDKQGQRGGWYISEELTGRQLSGPCASLRAAINGAMDQEVAELDERMRRANERLAAIYPAKELYS